MGKKRYHFKSVTPRDLNLVRRIHISLLATPKDRVLKPWPDPKLERTLPAPVSQAAMKAKSSERTIMLFKSKKMYTEGKKYEPPVKPTHYVSRAAMNAVSSARTAKLALPKQIHKLSKKLSKKAIAKRKKKVIAFKKGRDEWLKSRAAPKKVHTAPPEPERVWSFPMKKWTPQTRYQRIERLNLLAQPPARRKIIKPAIVKTVGQVIRLETSDRIRELALPRKVQSETLRNLRYKPGEIKRNVLRAVASERTKVLAKPRPRSKAVDNDVREDAFTISPTALKYKASRRIIDLAKPRIKI